MEGVLSEWGTFLSDIAHGKATQLRCKKGYQIGVVIAVPPFPFEDEKAFRKYSEDDKPSSSGSQPNGITSGRSSWRRATGSWRVGQDTPSWLQGPA